MVEKRTVEQWVYELERPGAELTLSELMALTLIHIRENVKDARLGTEHLEGMLGTLDAMLAATHPVYGALAEKRGQAVPPPLASSVGASSPPGQDRTRA